VHCGPWTVWTVSMDGLDGFNGRFGRFLCELYASVDSYSVRNCFAHSWWNRCPKITTVPSSNPHHGQSLLGASIRGLTGSMLAMTVCSIPSSSRNVHFFIGLPNPLIGITVSVDGPVIRIVRCAVGCIDIRRSPCLMISPLANCRRWSYFSDPYVLVN